MFKLTHNTTQKTFSLLYIYNKGLSRSERPYWNMFDYYYFPFFLPPFPLKTVRDVMTKFWLLVELAKRFLEMTLGRKIFCC